MQKQATLRRIRMISKRVNAEQKIITNRWFVSLSLLSGDVITSEVMLKIN